MKGSALFTATFSSESLEPANSPYINRFLQPDTIIPDLSTPQSWNRYSYVTNRPINFNDPTGHKDSCGDNGGGCSSNYTTPPPADPCDIHPEVCGEDPDDELSGGIEGEAGSTDENLTFGDYMAQGLEYCPFGQVCEPAMDLFWEQLAVWLMPSYASGSKNSMFVMYGFMAAGSEGITIVSSPDGRFVIYHEYSEFGHSGVFGPHLTGNVTKGIIFGMVDPLDYSDKSVGYGRPSINFPISAGGWITPDLKLKGVDASASFGVSLPGASVGTTTADPIGSGQFHGFMFFFCRAVFGGCGR